VVPLVAPEFVGWCVVSRLAPDGGVVTCFKPPIKPRPKPPWHSSLPFKSEKRADRKPLEQRMLERLLVRDGGCVVAGEAWINGVHECSGDRVPHHRRKANACGGYTEYNLVLLCVQANNDVENEPEWVRSAFPWLVVREGDDEWDACGGQR